MPKPDLKDDQIRVLVSGPDKALMAEAAQLEDRKLAPWLRRVGLEAARQALGIAPHAKPGKKG